MKEEYTIRPAIAEDIPFLADAIMGAEASGTDKPGMARLFDLSLERARELVIAMLEEEIDGCELSVSSFLVADAGEGPVATVAGWVEGMVDDMPSSLLKSNLIGFTFPAESLAVLRTRKDVIMGIQMERETGSLQIEYVYTMPDHRGHGLAGRAIEEHVVRSTATGVRKAQVQVFTNNTAAIKAYERAGFVAARSYRSSHPDTLLYLPWNEKLLMERTIIS